MNNFLKGRSWKRLAVALPFFLLVSVLQLLAIAIDNLAEPVARHLDHLSYTIGEWMNVRPGQA